MPKKPQPWMGMLIACAVATLCYLVTASSIESDAHQRFVDHARTAQNTIDARIKSYSDLVRGAASLFRTGYPITRTQFHDYVSALELERNFAAVETINVAELVSDAELPALEQRMARGHLPGDPVFQVRPAGKRPSYTVLTMIEPPVQLDKTLGVDLQMNQRGQLNLERGRDSGTLIASGRPLAAVSRPNQTVLAMRLPLYRAGWPVGSVAERRAAYFGSVGIAFSVSRLVQGALDEMPIPKVRMTVADLGLAIDPVQERLLIFDSSGGAQGPAPPLETGSGNFAASLPVDYHGRPWQVSFSVPKASMYTGFDDHFPWLAALAGLVGTILVYALLGALTSSRQRAVKLARGMTRELRDSQARLQQSHQKLRRLAAHADHIKEGERKRVAREIHEDLGQNLLALRVEAGVLAARTGEGHPRLRTRVLITLSQIDATIASVRQIINDLRPLALDLGLSAAVKWQVQQFRMRTGLSCELIDNEREIGLDERCATALFRILQESLSNIIRHARATRVTVELREHAGQVTMRVSDDGVGMADGGHHKAGSFGLVGIEERVHMLGGSCTLTSTPGNGTTIAVSVPYRRRPGEPAGAPHSEQP